MSEVHGEGLAPDPKVPDLVYGQVAGKGQDDGLAVVASQRHFLAVLVGHSDTLGRGRGSGSNPEFRICGEKKNG